MTMQFQSNQSVFFVSLLVLLFNLINVENQQSRFVYGFVPSISTSSSNKCLRLANKPIRQSTSVFLSPERNNDDDQPTGSGRSAVIKSEWNRQDFVRSVFGLVTIAMSGVGTSLAAFAEDGLLTDIPTTVAPLVSSSLSPSSLDQVAVSSALRRVKSSYKKLNSPEVANLIATNDYAGIKEIVRVAPVSEIRKSCSSLIKLSLPTPLSLNDEQPKSPLEDPYRTFIQSLEKMDSIASLGMRGKKFSNEAELSNAYQTVTSSLLAFIQQAEQILL